jgi:excisionase family DNA binding protein
MIPDPRAKPTLDTVEAAALLGTSSRTLYELVRRGEAPIEPLRLGARLRWPTQRLLDLLGLSGPERDEAPTSTVDAAVLTMPPRHEKDEPDATARPAV